MSELNKLGISDETVLIQKEEEITKKKCIEYFEKGLFNKYKAGSADSLIKLHKYLYDEIYEKAGKIKNKLKNELKNIEMMPQTTIDEIVDKYLKLYSCKVFSYGNELISRLWLEVIIRKELNAYVDWNKINADEYIIAVEFESKDSQKFKKLLEAAIVDVVENREVLIASMDANFAISGLKTYRTRVLG